MRTRREGGRLHTRHRLRGPAACPFISASPLHARVGGIACLLWEPPGCGAVPWPWDAHRADPGARAPSCSIYRRDFRGLTRRGSCVPAAGLPRPHHAPQHQVTCTWHPRFVMFYLLVWFYDHGPSPYEMANSIQAGVCLYFANLVPGRLWDLNKCFLKK